MDHPPRESPETYIPTRGGHPSTTQSPPWRHRGRKPSQSALCDMPNPRKYHWRYDELGLTCRSCGFQIQIQNFGGGAINRSCSISSHHAEIWCLSLWKLNILSSIPLPHPCWASHRKWAGCQYNRYRSGIYSEQPCFALSVIGSLSMIMTLMTMTLMIITPSFFVWCEPTFSATCLHGLWLLWLGIRRLIRRTAMLFVSFSRCLFVYLSCILS